MDVTDPLADHAPNSFAPELAGDTAREKGYETGCPAPLSVGIRAAISCHAAHEVAQASSARPSTPSTASSACLELRAAAPTPSEAFPERSRCYVAGGEGSGEEIEMDEEIRFVLQAVRRRFKSRGCNYTWTTAFTVPIEVRVA